MRRLAAPLSAALILATASARAEEPKQVAAEASDDDTTFRDRFVLDTGRLDYKQMEAGLLSFAVHGEYQLRYHAMSDLRLTPPIGQNSLSSLGQNHYLYHWLRVGAKLNIFDKLALVAQIDAPRGFIVGDTTQSVDAARDSFAQAKWYEVHPRYLYLEYASPIGIFRLGQQGSHWGMGILANDGDHPTLFGDYRRGSLVERLLYAVTPMGKDTPLFIALGGDLVFQDAQADLLSGDRAFQAVAAIGWRTKHWEIAAYGVGRHQERGARSVDQYTPFTESLTVGVLDLTARFDAPVPGAGGAFVYGQAEAATIFGSTSYIRGAYGNPVDPTTPRGTEKVRSYGGAATLGVVKTAGEGSDRWGLIAAEIELGYASGDANPSDGVTRRFTFDENHRVGLVLFDQVLRWKTARAATIAQDPSVVARAAPGLEFLSSQGGVFGAQYVNPRFVARPKRWVDIKGGVVVAQTTADFVDPYQFGAQGNARNYDGGNPLLHDLGVEIDVGTAFRIPIDTAAVVQLGAEGGVLFPGHAFDDAAGHKLANQYLATAQVGIQF